MSNFYANYPGAGGGGGGGNASVGPNGSTIPADSTLIGSEDGSGNLQPASTANPIPVSATALPLPAGAATSALQTSGNTLLGTIITDLTNGTQVTQITGTVPLPTGSATAALQSNVQSAPGTPQTVAVTVQGNASGVAVPVSASALPLPSGAATSANQTNGTQKTQLVDGSGNVISSTTNWLNVDVQASALPSGAATSANQTTEITALQAIQANQTNKTQTSQLTDGTNTAAVKAASTAPLTTDPALVVAISPNTVQSAAVRGTAIGNGPIQNLYGTTNITTTAYVQLVASTSNVINTIHIFDSSGQAMILGIGGSGSEVTTLYVPPGGDTYTLTIPAGSRIAYKALSANATSGYLLMSFLE